MSNSLLVDVSRSHNRRLRLQPYKDVKVADGVMQSRRIGRRLYDIDRLNSDTKLLGVLGFFVGHAVSWLLSVTRDSGIEKIRRARFLSFREPQGAAAMNMPAINYLVNSLDTAVARNAVLSSSSKFVARL